MARLRPPSGPVHDAQEVRRRRGEPELHGAVVERAHADRFGDRHSVRGSSPGRSRARSRSRRRARARRVEHPLDPELDVVRGQRRAVRPAQPLAEMEDVRAGRRRRSPTARRATARSCAPATPPPAGRRAACRAGCSATRSRSADRGRSGGSCSRCAASRSASGGRRRPPRARTLAGRSSFASRETHRGVQRQCELEQDECHRLRLTAPLEQRQQLAVVADRLVERVLLPRLVAGAGQVVGRLLLVLGREPVMGEQGERVVGRIGRSSSHVAPPRDGAAGARSRRSCGRRLPGSARA